MNNEIIKSIIKYKLNLADKVINHLPESISGDVKDIRNIIV